MKYLIAIVILGAVFGGGYYLTTKNATAPGNGEHMMEDGSKMMDDDQRMMGTSTEMMGTSTGSMMDEGGMGMGVNVEAGVNMGMMQQKTVTYSGSGFSPATIEVKVGEKVKFINNSEAKMWVASNNHPTHTLYPEFDQDKGVGKGESYEFTFTKAGKWKYHDHLSANKGGTVIVK